MESTNESAQYFHTTLSLDITDVSLVCMLDLGFFDKSALTYTPHVHLAYELHYVLDGCYDMEICDTGEVFRIEPGYLLIIPPGCYHNALGEGDPESKRPTYSDKIKKYSLRFTIAENTSASHTIPDSNRLYNQLTAGLPTDRPCILNMESAGGIFKSVHDELTLRRTGCDTLVSFELGRFFIMLTRLLTAKITDGTGAKSDREPYTKSYSGISRQEMIILYMDRNCHLPITEETLANEMHLSVRQISRIFKEQFSSTFRKTLTEIRLHHAEKLLERTDITAEKIALRIGYSSPSAFFTVFRKKHGISPGEYRSKRRKTE